PSRLAALLFALALLGLGGCVERGSLPGRSLEPIGPIYGPHTAGQRLVPRAGATIVALDVRLATYARTNAGTVTLHLRRASGDARDVRTASVEARMLTD